MYLQDALSNRDYLVDTGASRSVFPHRSSAAPTGPRLLMADGRPTKAWGSRLIPLQFGSRRFQFQFLLADVDQPILGADFLAEFDLLVDTKNRQVLQNLSFEPLAPPRFSPADSSVASVCKLHHILTLSKGFHGDQGFFYLLIVLSETRNNLKVKKGIISLKKPSKWSIMNSTYCGGHM